MGAEAEDAGEPEFNIGGGARPVENGRLPFHLAVDLAPRFPAASGGVKWRRLAPRILCDRYRPPFGALVVVAGAALFTM